MYQRMTSRTSVWSVLLSLSVLARPGWSAQPSAASPVPAPLRDLPWAQLNFLHTSDTHGWHAGHLQEPSYSADWGDYVSFAEHLHKKADAAGQDLILVDTGDRVEGNGLYDASEPRGKYDLAIFAQQDIDVICSGNHELYTPDTANVEFNTTVAAFKDSYIASNLDITDPKSGEARALAPRYKKFTTPNQGIRILSFGFLFNFANAAANVRVKNVEDAIKEQWFQDAIRDREVDLFLVIGHVALRSPEFTAIFKAIRSQQWDVPIHFFGGHTHIRDYAKYDGKAYALESGRYLETIGFASIDGLNAGGAVAAAATRWLLPSSMRTRWTASPQYARRYIDNNLYSLHYHSSTNSSTFSTSRGKNVSAMIGSARQALDLDRPLGCASQDYWVSRAPFMSNGSILSVLRDSILPEMVVDQQRRHEPRIILVNTGALRFDIFKGKVTRGTMYAVSPFTSGFRFIPNVPFSIAKRLLQVLNQEVPQLWPASELRALVPVAQDTLVASEALDPAADEKHHWYRHRSQQKPLLFSETASSSLTSGNTTVIPGYTTKDDAGTDGDDTLHSVIMHYQVPNCIEARVGWSDAATRADTAATDERVLGGDPETVDVVYNEFLQKNILLALQFLGGGYDEASTATYNATVEADETVRIADEVSGVKKGGKRKGKGEAASMTALIAAWITRHWPCP